MDSPLLNVVLFIHKCMSPIFTPLSHLKESQHRVWAIELFVVVNLILEIVTLYCSTRILNRDIDSYLWPWRSIYCLDTRRDLLTNDSQGRTRRIYFDRQSASMGSSRFYQHPSSRLLLCNIFICIWK